MQDLPPLNMQSWCVPNSNGRSHALSERFTSVASLAWMLGPYCHTTAFHQNLPKAIRVAPG